MIVILSASFAMWCLFFYGKGMSLWGILLLTVVWVFIPFNRYFIVTSWKDSPFLACFSIFPLCIAKLVFDGKMSGWLWKGLSVLSYVGMGLFRSNGYVICLVMFVVFLALAIMKKYRQFFKSVIIAFLFLLIIKVPVYNLIGVKPTPDWFISYPFCDAIAYNLYKGNSIPEDAMAFCEKTYPLEDYSNPEKRYKAYSWIDVYDRENISSQEAMSAYLEFLREYPLTTIWSRFVKAYNIWGVFPLDFIPANQNIVDKNSYNK